MTDHDNIKSLAKPKILVLDLDLTLHNVINHYNDSINKTLTHFKKAPLNDQELAAIGDNFTTTKNSLAAIFGEHMLKEVFDYYVNHFLNREISVDALLPGAQELLSLVKNELKLPIIAITNSDQFIAEKILKDLDTFKWFDQVIGIEDYHLPKPNPQMLFKALAKISAQAGPHIWFVGDRHSDTQCAKNAGCTAIRFYHINKPIDKNADLFINCHYNLYAIMKAKCENQKI